MPVSADTSAAFIADLRDVVTSRNRVGSAGAGYDLMTGCGTPWRVDQVVGYLASLA